mmetsp:Transcript_28821/g.43524  ORF Transcript_28821/g.43524 Transcript_28821/m.43524 type:complete len:334 (-) Transcript_28821:3098-4099(-)
MFFTVRYDGLYTIDVWDPENPRQVKVTNTGYRNRFMTTTSDEKTLFLSDSLEGFYIVDITDRTNPKVLNQIFIPRDFPEVQLRPMALSDDENTIYLNTYDGMMFVVNIFDRANPKVESILSVGSKFTIMQDSKWAVQLRYSIYELFDLSQIYMSEQNLLPLFSRINKPILFQDVKFSEAKQLKKFYHYSDSLDLIAYVDQPIRGSPTLQLYSTAISKSEPKFMGSFLLRHNETDKAQIWMEFSDDGTRLYMTTFLVFSEVFTFEIADTSNPSNPKHLDRIEFDPLERGNITVDLIGTMTNLVYDAQEQFVYFALTEDSLLAVSVANDKAQLAN